MPPRILLTGFGPFPGVPDNASASLATALAGHPLLAAAYPELHHLILPTSWTDAPRVFRATLEARQPALVISLGVSKVATGFVVETMARNIAAMPDVDGRQPTSSLVDQNARRFVTSKMPARHLVRTLRSAGFPATRSLNAGRYLCNTLLFEATRCGVPMTTFIHLPARLAGPGLPGVTPRLTWDQAVSGGVQLVNALATVTRQD